MFSPPPTQPQTPTKTSVGMPLVEAFGWCARRAVATAITGFFGDLIGTSAYPQRYEQFPSFLLLIPFGFFAGFVAGGVSRMAWPRLRPSRMLAVVAAVSLAYGVLLFDRTNRHAVAPRPQVTIEPNPADAVRCTVRTCPDTDPPSDWFMEGTVVVRDASELGGSVDAITLTSSEDVPRHRGPLTQEESETARLSGKRDCLALRQPD